MSHFNPRTHRDSFDDEPQANALQFQPLGRTGSQSHTGDAQFKPVTQNFGSYEYTPQLQTSFTSNYQRNQVPRAQLPQLNTDVRSLNMSQGSTNHSYAHHGQLQNTIPEWTPEQLALMCPLDFRTPNIFVDTVPPAARSSFHQGPLTPYDHPHYEHSPTTPTFPPSPSSGYQSSSPFAGPLPLTPNSAQHAGQSPMIVTPPIPPSPPYVSNQMVGVGSQNYPDRNTVKVVSPITTSSSPNNSPTVPGPLIPQRQYRPHTTSDRRRYVEEVKLEQAIVFTLQNPPQQGIPLRDALTSKFMRLEGRDDLMFENRGPSVSIRLEWEGYQAWSRQIPTRDFRSPPGPITRSKLAKNVAKSIERFIAERKDCTMDPDSNPKWRIGPGFIDVDDLLLVSLHHVSMGSWQANLRLCRPPLS